MKKQLLVLTIILLTSVLCLRAQNVSVQNAQFENWTTVDGTDYLDGWRVSDSLDMGSSITKSTDAGEGSYAVRFGQYPGVGAPYLEIDDSIPDGVKINQVEFKLKTGNISNTFTDGAVLKIAKYNADYDYLDEQIIRISDNTGGWVQVKQSVNMNTVKYILVTVQLWDFSKSGAYAIFDDIKLTKNTASINELDYTSTSVYPNPAQDVITIDTELPISSVSIRNQLGQLVKQYDGVLDNALDVSDLPKGMYVVQAIRADGKLLSSKFLKQ